MVAMRDLLRDLYTETTPRTDLRAADVVQAYRLHCCKAGCQSNYLLYLEEKVTVVVVNVVWLGVGLAGCRCEHEHHP